MKCVWLLLMVMTIMALMPADSLAQEPIKATTFDGKHVLLFRDGSWKPATTDPGSVAHLGAFAEPQQVTLYSRRMYDDYMKRPSASSSGFGTTRASRSRTTSGT
jgi:hypothetical protein